MHQSLAGNTQLMHQIKIKAISICWLIVSFECEYVPGRYEFVDKMPDIFAAGHIYYLYYFWNKTNDQSKCQ